MNTTQLLRAASLAMLASLAQGCGHRLSAPPSARLGASTLRAIPSTAPADGASLIELLVLARGPGSQPLSGWPVRIVGLPSHVGGQDPTKTDEQGSASFRIHSDTAGSYKVHAELLQPDGNHQIGQELGIEFLSPSLGSLGLYEHKLVTTRIPIGPFGDLDGDGHPDFLAPGSQSGNSALRSGVSDRLLYELPTAWRLAPIGDVDHDKVPDLLSYRSADARRGEFRVVSGKTRKVLSQDTVDSGGYLAALEMAGAGDIDGDGNVELWVGMAHASNAIAPPSFRSIFLSTTTWQETWRFESASEKLRPLAADSNLDGIDDLLGLAVDARGELLRLRSGLKGKLLREMPRSSALLSDYNRDGWPEWFEREGPFLRIRDGKTLQPIATRRLDRFLGPELEEYLMADLGDVDGDGVPDLIYRRRILSGRDLRTLHEIELNVSPSQSGSVLLAVEALGDCNGDKVPDFATLMRFRPKSSPSYSLTMRVHSGKGLTLRANDTWISNQQGGKQTLQIDFGKDFAVAPYFFLGSQSGVLGGILLAGVRVPLHPDSWFYKTLASNVPAFVPKPGVLDGQGRGSSDFVAKVGMPTWLSTVQFHHAAVALNGKGLASAVSNAIPLRIRALR